MPGAIDQYLATLRRELAFDPRLAARLCDEVEEHLQDIVEQDAGNTEEHAVDRMGDPRRLAGEMARAAWPSRLRVTWHSLGLCIVAVLLAMRLRNEILPVDQAPITVFVDRLAFGTALFLGIAAAWSAWAKQPVRYVVRLAVGSVSLLAVSALVGITMFLRLYGLDLAPTYLPLLALAAEWGVLLLAFASLQGLVRHARIAG